MDYVVSDPFGSSRSILYRQLNSSLYAGAIAPFFISTFFGIIPATAVFSSIGAGLGEVFAVGEKPNLSIIFEPHILLPILGFAALSLVPAVIKAVTGKRAL